MKRFLLTAFPYAVFLLLLLVSWNRWIEPYVDSGRELMVPQRIAQGEALYRDIRFYHGPLAPYLAAGIDLLFGRSLAARIALAMGIALAHLEALRRLASRWLSAARASLVAGAIVAVAFFLRPGGELFPFSFDTSLAVAAITWALLLATGPSAGARDRAAGVCLAAALLCRPEMGAAAILLLVWETRLSRRLLFLAWIPLAVCATLYAILSAGTPWTTLRQEGWLALLRPPESFRNVYAAYAGLDRPALRLAELALASIVILLIATLLLAAAFCARAARTHRRGAGVVIEAAALLLLAAAAWTALDPPPRLAETIALLPPLVRVVPALVVAGALTRAIRRVTGGGRDLFAGVPDAVLFTAALFGLRLFLAAGYAGPYNAFLLPLPLLVAAVFLFAAADRARNAAGESLPRLLAGVLLLFLLFRTGTLAQQYRRHGWSRVDTPVGPLFLLEPVASTTRLALADLAARVPAGGPMVGFPEAGFFHYALGLSNPLAQEQFFPGHLDARLEEETIGALTHRPPQAVVLCNVLAVGHGSRAFGRDYLVRLDEFLRQRFQEVACFGPGAGPEARVGDPQFFVAVRTPRQAP